MHGASPGPIAHETILQFSLSGAPGAGSSTIAGRLIEGAGAGLADSGETARSAPTGPVKNGPAVLFATGHRAFILEWASGRGAAPADEAIVAPASELAVIVVDATKGLVPEARRHLAVARTIGARHVVLAVNKLDLLAWDRTAFHAIAEAFRSFTANFDFASAIAIPLSALTGDNIATRSTKMPWYQGPTLLSHLEWVPIDPERKERPLRLPVVSVSRPDPDRRLYLGTIASGALRCGDTIQVAISGVTSTVDRILVDGSERERADAGEAIAIELSSHIDLGGGDVLVHPEHPPHITEQFAAHLVWLAEEPLFPGRDYSLRMGSREVVASVTSVKHRFDIETLRQDAVRTLQRNEIGACTIATPTPLAIDAFGDIPQTAGFTLYDRFSGALIAAGTVDFVLRRGVNIHLQPLTVSKSVRASLKGQGPCIIWFTGLSGAGKSTIANLVEGQLAARGSHTYLLDGDNVRHGLNKNLGFTAVDRIENIRRVGEVAKLFVDAGLIVICSFISPFRAERAAVRGLVEPTEFIEIFVDAPLDVCERRDPKGLYAKSRAGGLPNFTGIDSPYEQPESPDLVLDTTSAPAAELARRVMALLDERGVVAQATSKEA